MASPTTTPESSARPPPAQDTVAIGDLALSRLLIHKATNEARRSYPRLMICQL